jgi:hypothetical protein
MFTKCQEVPRRTTRRVADRTAAVETSRRHGKGYEILTNPVAKPRTASDGLSNTLFYTEDAGRPQRYVAGKRLLPGSTPMTNSAAWCDEAAEFGLHGCQGTTGTRPGTQHELHERRGAVLVPHGRV